MTVAAAYLPDGQLAIFPAAPRTWTDAGPATIGDPLRAPLLTADVGAAVAWHRQRPLYQGIQTGVQSIPNNSWTPLNLYELIDNYAGHSGTTNPSRYYAPSTRSNTSGGDWYLCSGQVTWHSSDTAHLFSAGLRITGGTPIAGSAIPGAAGGHQIDQTVIDLVQMSGLNSDYVELVGRQLTGAAVETIVVGKVPSLTVRWVAADPAWAEAYTPALPDPHVWTEADVWAGDLTGGAYVPANREVRDLIRFLHNPPAARLTAAGGSQSIPSGAGTWTPVNWTTAGKSLDNYGGWSSGTPSRYTIQRDGIYLVAGLLAVNEPGSNSGYRAVRLRQTLAAGGTIIYPGWACPPATSGTTGTAIYAVAMVRAAAGDYIETQASHTQGSALTVTPGTARMICVWMAA